MTIMATSRHFLSIGSYLLAVVMVLRISVDDCRGCWFLNQTWRECSENRCGKFTVSGYGLFSPLDTRYLIEKASVVEISWDWIWIGVCRIEWGYNSIWIWIWIWILGKRND